MVLKIFWALLPDIGLAVRVFANGPGDLGSIPGRVIPKTQKMVLDASLLNTQHYKVWIKGKVEQSRDGVAPSPTLWCSSYRKGSLRVTLDYGRQLYFTYYRGKDELQWTSAHGHISVSQPIKTYFHQVCMDTGCRLEDLQRVITDRERWPERINKIHPVVMP